MIMKKLLLVFLVSITMHGCQVRAVNGDEVLQSLLNSNDEPMAYYQETEYRWDDGDSFYMKEWKQVDGRVRTEMFEKGRLQSVMIHTPNHFHVVDYEAEQILVGDNQNSDEWNDLIQRSPRKWLLDMLQNVYDSYSIDVVNEATHLGRKTFILELNENNDDGERTELWVDKETWMILKSVSENEEYGYVSEVIHLELEPEMDEQLFVMDENIGFEVVSFDELTQSRTITLEEAKQLTNESFLVPSNEFELVELTVFSEHDDLLLDFLYRKANFSAAFSYSVIKAGDTLEAIFGEEEPITIRGREGWILWDDIFNSIIFHENGLQYSFYFETGLTKEEAIRLVEQMVSY